MPSHLPPLQPFHDAPAAPRAAPPRHRVAQAEFAETLSRSHRASQRSDPEDSPPQAEPARQDDEPQPQEPQPAADPAGSAAADAQGTADEAQALPQGTQSAAQTTQGDSAAAATQPGAATDAAGQGPRATQDSAAAQSQLVGAARAGEPANPGAPRSDGQDATAAGAPRPFQAQLKDPSAPQPSQQAAHADKKQSTDAGDAAARLAADPPVARDPAVGRALQVQAALAVENLTRSAPDLGAGARTAASDRPVFAGAPATPSAASALQQEQQPGAALVRGLNAMVNHSGGVMTMRLEPPELGQLRVQMTIAHGMVTAHFQPATAEAQAMLERTLPALRAALEAHGLAAERLTVQTAPQPAPPAREQPQEQPPQGRHDHDAGGGESRGRRDGGPQEHHRRAAWHPARFEVPAATRRSLQGAIAP